MNKTLVKLVVAGVALAGLSTAQAQNINPADGLPTCAAVYGTMSVFAAPENKAILKERGAQILKVALKYNPQASNGAIGLMKDNVARVNANDPTVVREITNAELFCRTYVKQYGL